MREDEKRRDVNRRGRLRRKERDKRRGRREEERGKGRREKQGEGEGGGEEKEQGYRDDESNTTLGPPSWNTCEGAAFARATTCLFYTSASASELTRVDLYCVLILIPRYPFHNHC